MWDIFWNINFSMLLYYYLSFDNKNFTKYSRTGVYMWEYMDINSRIILFYNSLIIFVCTRG